ncbi:MAG: DNA-directed RNA polymerase subunit beta [Candidatus Portnoybacteria bacterium]|nr:DNA-directed RNA polymerase subunit beta [Candidatus Portnoybacteria bacterium]
MREKYFSQYAGKTIPFPHLIQVQLDSYRWFLEKGLQELLEDSSPVEDYSGEHLRFYFLKFSLGEPEYTEEVCRQKNLTYEAPLRVQTRLHNLLSGEIKEQDIYFGHIPLISSRGTFVINGVERVVVSQLLRSPGVYFTVELRHGQRFFGAQVIPGRGAWIELETSEDGVIYAKVDRRRKVNATVPLRAFGLASNEDIVKACGESVYLRQTLEGDDTKTPEEAAQEIYKRLRPGEVSTPEAAKKFLQNLFSFKRYDLEKVGRWKLDQRLGHPLRREEEISKAHRVVNLQDMVDIFKEVARLNQDPLAKPDEIDNLGNRRVRPVGMLLQDRLRLTFARMERVIKDRMSTLDLDTLTPGQLININIFSATIQDFFSSSQLSQFMDQVNSLAELEHKRTLSSKGPGGLTQERAGFEVRDVHESHYGRICPIQTPEGQNVGLVTHLALFARLNEFGFLETPYFKVEKGRVTDTIEYLDAFAESRMAIAHAGEPLDSRGRFLHKVVQARIKGEPGMVEREALRYRDVSPQQCISVATALIPFLEHDDANRAQMGANMQRQAVPCLKPEAPLVATEVGKAVAQDASYSIFAREAGKVVVVDASQIVIEESKTGEFSRYPLINFRRSNQYTVIHQKPLIEKGAKVKKGDLIATGSSTDDGTLALGQNLLVAFLPWEGANFEDAIVISERVVREDILSSLHIQDYLCQVRDTKLGPEVTTYDIPNVSEARLSQLDEDGVIRIGSEVKEGSYLVGKISPKGEAEMTGEERLLRAIFGEKAREVRDTSLVLPHGAKGKVMNINILSRERGDKLAPGVVRSIQVEVGELRKVTVGDKLAGRHGNKGVISKILPIEDMPYLPDGTQVDIILNPLGIASRMNLGQVLETHLGWAASKLGYRAISSPFAGATEKEIQSELAAAGLGTSGKITLYDGRGGEAFSQEGMVGVIYIMKLNHLVEDKAHARSIGPYSLTTQQPLGGKAQFGGQRFGEMEAWALEAYGAAHTLQEILTIKSDDVKGRAEAYEAIIKGQDIRKPYIPTSFYVLVNEIKGLGFDVELAPDQRVKR